MLWAEPAGAWGLSLPSAVWLPQRAGGPGGAAGPETGPHAAAQTAGCDSRAAGGPSPGGCSPSWGSRVEREAGALHLRKPVRFWQWLRNALLT